MEKKLNGFNKVDLVGKVVNFSIYPLKSGKKKAELGIKDESDNNVCYVQMFENDKMKYGGRSVTLNDLKNIFVDGEGKSKGVLVSATGKVAENSYMNSKTKKKVVSTKPTIWKINPYSDENKQKIVFNFTGIVERLDYNDDCTKLDVRLGIVRSGADKEYFGVEYITCEAEGEIMDNFETSDIEVGDKISIKGDILNKFPEKDKYGNSVKGAVAEKGFKIAWLGSSVTKSDEMDLNLYEMLKGGDTTASSKQKPDSKEDKTKDGLDF